MGTYKDIISAHMAIIGSKGGDARAKAIGPKRLREIAIKASKAAAKKRLEKKQAAA